MEVVWSGSIAGVFSGYTPRQVYALSDGSRWRQEDDVVESRWRDSPRARLLRDPNCGRVYLDVDGASETVWVERVGGSRVPSYGAF